MLGEKFQSPIRAKFRTLVETVAGSTCRSDDRVVVYEVKFPDTTMYLDSSRMAERHKAKDHNFHKNSRCKNF